MNYYYGNLMTTKKYIIFIKTSSLDINKYIFSNFSGNIGCPRNAFRIKTHKLSKFSLC